MRGYRAVLSVMEQGAPPTQSIEEQPSCDVLGWVLAERLRLAMGRKPAPACPSCPGCPTCAAPKTAIVETCDAACMEKIEARLCAKYGRCMGPTLTVMGGGLITLGWTLNVGPGAWLGGEARWDQFSLGVEARGMFPESMARGYVLETLSDLVSFSGLVVPCGRWKIFFACGFVEAGVVIYTAPGRADGRGDVSDFLFAFGPRAGLDIPLARGFSIRTFADLPIHPYLPVGVITDGDDPNKTVHRVGVPIVNGFVSVGLAWTALTGL